MELSDILKEKAKKFYKKIVLPESYDERTLIAADTAIAEKMAQIFLIGNAEAIKSHAKKLGLKNIDKASIVDPSSNPKKEHYIDMMVELRKHKGLTRQEAMKLIEDPCI